MGDVLPVIKNVKVLEGFDAGGVPRLRDPRRPVTLRHLLTHTSGYGYDVFNPDIARYVELVGLPSSMSRENDSLRVPLLFDPGAGGLGIRLRPGRQGRRDGDRRRALLAGIYTA